MTYRLSANLAVFWFLVKKKATYKREGGFHPLPADAPAHQSPPLKDQKAHGTHCSGACLLPLMLQN